MCIWIHPLNHMKTYWKESLILGNNLCFWGNTWAFYVCVRSGSRAHVARLPGHHISAQEKTRCKKIKNSWQTVVKRAERSPKTAVLHEFSGNKFKIQRDLYWFQVKYGEIRCICTFGHRLTRIFNLNTSVFPEPRYDDRAIEHHAYGSQSQRTRKRPGVDSIFPEY